MGERTSYPQGAFSWVDLATTDVQGAKSFYSGLFGWDVEDMPTGDGGVYSMARLDGKYVAAVSAQREEERELGAPPHWNSYVTVEDVDATAAKVPDLGGQVFVPPFDVLDAGRMAVIADPTGAFLPLWQPRNHIGAGLVNVPGALTWNELNTPDVEKARRFYQQLLGWTFEDFGAGEYTVIRVGDRSNGGIRQQTEEEQQTMPAFWIPYFAVEETDQAASKAGDLGATVMMPPMDVPTTEGARIAILTDPQGAAFALFAGPLDD